MKKNSSNSREDQLELSLAGWFDLDLPPALSPDLRKAQEELVEGAAKGTRCPCCGRLAKVYVERLHSSMARSLVWMVQRWEAARLPDGAPPDGFWIEPQREAPRHVLRSRKLGRLEHWALLESRPNVEDPTKRTSGQWRPTLLGVRFVNDSATVPSRIYLYQNRVVGQEKTRIGIRDALGKRFNYEELMGTRPEIRHG